MKAFQVGLASLCTFVFLGSCGPAPQNVDTQPTPAASSATAAPSTLPPSPSTAPSAVAPTPEPTVQPTVQPTAPPSVTPTPTPAPTPEPTPTPTPEPTPTPVTTGSILVKVFDENGSPVNVAQVSGQDNEKTGSFSGTATKEGSNYTLNDVPVNQTIELKVTAPGYTTRTRLVSVTSFAPNTTIEFKDTFAISSRPEVLSVEPKGSLTSQYQTLTIRFSEFMNKESVERSLGFQLSENNDTQFLVGTPAPAAKSLGGNENDTIYDIRHFNFEWDGDDVLKLTPKFGWPRTSSNRYRIILTYRRAGDSLGGGVKDQDGVKARDIVLSTGSNSNGDNIVTEDGPFRNGNKYQASWPLSVDYNPDETEVTGLAASNNGDDDSITVTFSDDLSFSIANGSVVIGGANGSSAAAPAGHANVTAQDVAQNYRLTCNGTEVPWPAGSNATLSSGNQVRIRSNNQNIFDSGDQCVLRMNGIQDPRGASIPNPDESFGVP